MSEFDFLRKYIGIANCRSIAVLCGDTNKDFCERMASYIESLGVDAEVYEVVKAKHRERVVNTVFKASRNPFFAISLYVIFVVKPLFWFFLRFVQTRVSEEVLDRVAKSDMVIWVGLAEDFDVYFLVDRRVHKALRGKHVVLLGYPSVETAKMLNIPYEEYYRNFMNSLNPSIEELKKISDKLIEQFKNASRLKVLTPHGTDLQMKIEHKYLGVFYGVMNEEAYRKGRLMLNLPAGEVGFASNKKPLEVSGEIYVDVPCILVDKVVYGARFTVEKGVLVKYDAERNKEALDKYFKNRNSRRVYELSFGLNPATKPCGSMILDEKAYGTVHVGFGRPRTPLHADFVMTNPKILVDEREIEL